MVYPFVWPLSQVLCHTLFGIIMQVPAPVKDYIFLCCKMGNMRRFFHTSCSILPFWDARRVLPYFPQFCFPSITLCRSISKSCRFFCIIVCSVSPEKKDWMAASMVKPQTISVGKFGTYPVFR